MTARPLSEIVENARFGSLHLRVLALSSLIAVVDGFDVSAMAVATSSVAAEWGLAVGLFGPALSASLVGLALGGVLGGPLGDRWGRRPTLVLMFLIGVLATAGTALATDITSLILFRFLTGLGLGGTIPLGAALCAEFLPRRNRGLLLTLMLSGHPVGGALANFAAPGLIQAFGWQSIFLVGGLLPLTVCGLLFFWLPESPSFLHRTGQRARLDPLLRRLSPAAFDVTPPDEKLAGPSALKAIRSLFTGSLLSLTLMLWLLFFGTQFTLFLLASWLPALFRENGLALDTALYAGMCFQIGGVVGTIVFGALTDRFPPMRVIGAMYVLGALTIAALSRVEGASLILFVAAFGAGVGAIGAQLCLNGVTTLLYPDHIRGSGLGWALSFGRLGAILGPVLVGELLVAQWSPRDILIATAAVPLACALVILLFLGRSRTVVPSSDANLMVH